MHYDISVCMYAMYTGKTMVINIFFSISLFYDWMLGVSLFY